MASKLDQLDLRIVHQLQVEGRALLTELAEKVGSSRQTVANRLKRLLDEELVIVRGGLNLQKFGFKMASVGLEVRTDKARREVEQFLKKCPRVLSIYRTPEKANIHVSVWGEDDQTINSTIESFRDNTSVDIVYTRYLGTPIHGNIAIDVEPSKNSETPCGMNCTDCQRYSNAWCAGCPASSDYRNPLLE